MSQMATQIGEREKEIFSIQTIANPKDPRLMLSNPAQVNTIHTLRSGKEVDNQVVMPEKTVSSHPKDVQSSSGSN